MARRPEFVECKTLGHAWEEYNALGGRRNGLRLTVRCVRCGSTRHDELSKAGDVEQRKYTYPDGYKVAKDERPSRAALRLFMARKK